MNIIDKVLHRDGLILVIDKPSGLPVHKGPKAAGFKGAVLTDLLDELRFGLPQSPALAHRLDRDTSGCLILGRHRKSLEVLGDLFKARLISKTYLAVVEGVIVGESGVINAPLMKRDAKRGWWMKVEVGGEEAITQWRVVARFENKTAVELKPLTGRTHQLRVHMQHLGFPIVGDAVYGSEKRFSETRLHLHAFQLSLPHNLKKNSAQPPLLVSAPVPQEMVEYFGMLGCAHYTKSNKSTTS